MVDETTTSDDNTVTNKGVNVRSDTSNVRKYLDNTSASSSTNPPSRSLTDIKNEIQTVLDLMGPSSPNMSTQQNTSSEADNEESVTSVVSKSKSSETSEKRSVRRSLDHDKNSVVADVGTTTSLTNNLENLDSFDCLCCNNMEPIYFRNPNCPCMLNYINQNLVVPPPIVSSKTYGAPTNNRTSKSTEVSKKRSLIEWLKTKPFELTLKRSSSSPCDLYKINISGQDEDGLPKRVIFDLVDGIPKPSSSTVATNTIRNPVEKFKTNSSKSSTKCDDHVTRLSCSCKEIKDQKNESNTQEKNFIKAQKYVSCDNQGNTRVDYYYFDHGNAQYFHTTDTPPVMVCEIIAEKTEKYTTKFWAEFFASIHIVFSFCISFILQLFKFILYSIARPLTVGVMQLSSDYFFKPFLTTLFNGLVQPCLIFLYNVATSLRDLCDPIAEGIGYFIRELAVLCKTIRLCTYKKNTNEDNCDCNKHCKCKKKHKSIC